MQCFKIKRLYAVITVYISQICSPGNSGTGISCGGKSSVLSVDDSYPGIRSRDLVAYFRTVVRRTVVYKYDLKICIGLCEYGINTDLQILFNIVNRYYNAYELILI